MATFDITSPLGVNEGQGDSGFAGVTPPGDFDGATITDVSVVGSPTITTDGQTDDTIGVRFRIQSSAVVAIWGDYGSDAVSLCSASLADEAGPDTITDGSAPSPAPSIAVAADWDNIAFEINYAANMMADAETISFSTFTIRVTYTPLPNIQQESYRFCTPITGAAHEAYTLVGVVDTSFEITLDVDYCLIIKVGNDGGLSTSNPYQLEYNVDGGGWNDVNASSSNVRSAASGDTDNATSLVERLTTTSRSFLASGLDEVDGLRSFTIDENEDAELYYALTFRSADLSGGESIDFRLTATDSVTLDITPNATVASGAPLQAQVMM